ncbi:MAG: hypothetical protein DMG16_27465 [Acidobacteria bacterium]|nr:MAG: hypothetical protein DMG16_27465 [Acidobacteriota bacterium]
MLPLLALIIALQSPQAIKLKRFEIVRVDPAGMNRLPPSLRAIFAEPVPDAEPVASLNEAATRAGFTPRLPKSATPLQIGVTDPVHADARIEIAALNQALRDGTVTNVTVPQDWDAVTIAIEQGRGVLADYGDFLIVQAPPLTLNTPSGFPLDQFVEVLFRVVGINGPDARTLREKFAANPAVFFPIPIRYEMDIHEVRLNSGSGLLMQNASKVGDLALVWSTTDHIYFLSGGLTETRIIELANSIQ